jgi:hypothetical protein
MNGPRALLRGISLVGRYPQAWLLLFGANLVSALLLAALPALTLASGLAQRPVIQDVADGLDAWLVLESSMSSLAGAALETRAETAGGGPWGTLAALLLLAGLPLAAWLPPAFLEGGLLLTFLRAGPFRWRAFVGACWHWWGVFVLLAAVQGLATILVLAPLALGLAAAGGAAWAALPVLALALALGLALLEYTRILAVARGTRNPFRAFGLAARFVLRRPRAVLGLYALSLTLVALLHALYRLGLMPLLPLRWWLLVLAVQQSFILLRLGTRLVRLAGASALLRHAEGKPAGPDPTTENGSLPGGPS